MERCDLYWKRLKSTDERRGVICRLGQISQNGILLEL